MSFCSGKCGNDGGEKQCRNKQNPHGAHILSARIYHIGRSAVKQVDGYNEQEEDHEGDDAHDKAFDSGAGVIDFDPFRFLSALLTWLSIEALGMIRAGTATHFGAKKPLS